jgi:nucleotide-binding universal stress UspA family protein
MFQTILVATDGSDHGRNATRVAGGLAGRLGARLYVAHVITDQPVPESLRRMAEVEHLVKEPEPEQGSSLGRLSLKASPRVLDQRIAAAVATRVLEQAGTLARSEGAEDVVPLELSGDAAAALAEAVRDREVDLVVIGSRGFGALGRLVHGSVSTQVSHDVACPVMVVK